MTPAAPLPLRTDAGCSPCRTPARTCSTPPARAVGPASSNTDRSVRGGRHSVVSCTTFRRVPSTGNAHEHSLAEKNSVEIVIRANCLADRSDVTAHPPGTPAATTGRVDRHLGRADVPRPRAVVPRWWPPPGCCAHIRRAARCRRPPRCAQPFVVYQSRRVVRFAYAARMFTLLPARPGSTAIRLVAVRVARTVHAASSPLDISHMGLGKWLHDRGFSKLEARRTGRAGRRRRRAR